MTTMSGSAAGVLLAAGAGRRIGGPKALRHDADGTSWLLRAVGVLRDGGCDPIVVVLGAAADEAAELLTGDTVRTVLAADWDEGMGASLRAGLRALGETDSAVAVVHLVDLPDVGPDVLARLREAAGGDESGLVRAEYGGRPGHPVVIGRAHWADLAAELEGDEGARCYLKKHGAQVVECGDLARGDDVDELPMNT
ncbi:nucleotidyltransferase family protein [Calidifontibacter indicus]|uniref:nucleotidyltransferase family protein n=1 Tax=Calidifontibacter indicus TaxID=419650 RepID=UPI003D7455CF